jgi:hypothetical protein
MESTTLEDQQMDYRMILQWNVENAVFAFIHLGTSVSQTFPFPSIRNRKQSWDTGYMSFLRR